jgi:hypothetical protein
MKQLSYVPQRLLNKAAEIVDLFLNSIREGWKPLIGLKNAWYSFKLDINYRLLTDGRGTFFVGSHDAYEKKIKNLKRIGH